MKTSLVYKESRFQDGNNKYKKTNVLPDNVLPEIAFSQ